VKGAAGDPEELGGVLLEKTTQRHIHGMCWPAVCVRVRDWARMREFIAVGCCR